MCRSSDTMVNGAGVLLDPGFLPIKANHVYRLHADGRKDDAGKALPTQIWSAFGPRKGAK